jgi:hypothetical protein
VASGSLLKIGTFSADIFVSVHFIFVKSIADCRHRKPVDVHLYVHKYCSGFRARGRYPNGEQTRANCGLGSIRSENHVRRCRHPTQAFSVEPLTGFDYIDHPLVLRLLVNIHYDGRAGQLTVLRETPVIVCGDDAPRSEHLVMGRLIKNRCLSEFDCSFPRSQDTAYNIEDLCVCFS